jgi:hypothetical protein
MFDPDDKISGGQGFIYASSIVVAMRKLKLKTDADGNKTSDVHGIRAACKVMKTRYAKPFEGVQVEIPYATGMSATSGLIDLFEKKGLLVKQGNRLKYTKKDGTEMLEYRKAWTSDKLEIIMMEQNTTDLISNDEPEPVEKTLDEMTPEELYVKGTEEQLKERNEL